MSLLPLELDSGLVRRRGRVILGPVSLRLEPGGLTAVLGPNGAGKTTLLKVLHGIERLSAGQLRQGLPAREAQARQAFVFQTPIMLRRSVARNLGYPLELAGVAAPERRARITRWAARIRLEGALGLPAGRLSGGERQKLALARALIREPELLFLDEPCANLDGRSTREIEALLGEARAAGVRIVMTTHDLGQARRLADDVWFLLSGRVHETGTAPGIFQCAEREETRAWLRGDIVE